MAMRMQGDAWLSGRFGGITRFMVSPLGTRFVLYAVTHVLYAVTHMLYAVTHVLYAVTHVLYAVTRSRMNLRRESNHCT
jgi:hypothetical protein